MFSSSSSASALKIGLIRSSSIGDVVLATACLSLLRQLKMPVELTWIGRHPSMGLIQSCYPEHRYLELPDRVPGQDFLKKLEGLHFLIDLQGNLRSRLLALGFRRMWKRPVFNVEKQNIFRRKLVLDARIRGRSRPLPLEAISPRTAQYRLMTNALLKALSSQTPPKIPNDSERGGAVPQLPISGCNNLKSWQKELNFGCWLALAPGASYEAKRAPLQFWARIIARIRGRYYKLQGEAELPLGLLLLGDQKDRQFTLKLLDELGWNDPVLNMAGTLTLRESAQALHGRACLLSNDSSLAHMAEAVGTPAAVLFGPTVEGFGFAPRMAISRAFSLPLGCRPCSRHGQRPCRYRDQLCFSGLPVEEISRYVVSLLVRKVHKPEGNVGAP